MIEGRYITEGCDILVISKDAENGTEYSVTQGNDIVMTGSASKISTMVADCDLLKENDGKVDADKLGTLRCAFCLKNGTVVRTQPAPLNGSEIIDVVYKAPGEKTYTYTTCVDSVAAEKFIRELERRGKS